MFECDPIKCLHAFRLNTLHHIGVTLDITKNTFKSKARTQRASSSKFIKSLKSCFVYISRQKYLNENFENENLQPQFKFCMQLGSQERNINIHFLSLRRSCYHKNGCLFSSVIQVLPYLIAFNLCF